MLVTEPNKPKVGERQLQRKVEQVRDLMDWSSQGDAQTIEKVQQKVRTATAPPGVVELTIPDYGTMQLKTELLLCDFQLRTLRSMLSSWGGKGALKGWRALSHQESELSYPL